MKSLKSPEEDCMFPASWRCYEEVDKVPEGFLFPELASGWRFVEASCAGLGINRVSTNVLFPEWRFEVSRLEGVVA